MIIVLAREAYSAKDQRQHEGLVQLWSEMKPGVGYCRMVTITTSDPQETYNYRSGVNAEWPFLSDTGRIVQRDLDIPEYSDPAHNQMVPYTIVCAPGLVIYKIYNGYWFFGRPTVEELRMDLRAILQQCHWDWDPVRPAGSGRLGPRRDRPVLPAGTGLATNRRRERPAGLQPLSGPGQERGDEHLPYRRARPDGIARSADNGRNPLAGRAYRRPRPPYALAIEQAPGGALLHVVGTPAAPVAEIAAAASRAAGGEGRVQPQPLAQARRQMGPGADALALDQHVSPGRAQRLLGWIPNSPSVLDELEHGSYSP